MAALSLTDLHAWYGKAHVLQGVTLSVEAGQVVGVFGRNGVGKTTMLRAAMGLIQAVRGGLAVDGQDLSARPADERARAGLGLMPQGARVFPDLTVRENYQVAAYAARLAKPLDEIVGLIPELAVLLPRRAGRLSGGQQQLVSLMRSLAGNCKVLMMDEPTEGLMPSMVERIGTVARAVAAQGIGVLLVEQNLMLGEAVCDQIHLVEKGRIAASGSFLELRDSGSLQRILGLAARPAAEERNMHAHKA